MKKSLTLILLIVIIALSGCKYKKEAEQLQITNNDLTSQLTKSDSTLREYMSVINALEIRLDSIIPGTKAGQGTAAEIKARLDLAVTGINNLLVDNQKKYQSLRYSLNSKISSLERKIKDLEITIAERDSVINTRNNTITSLNNTIEDKSSQISDLNKQNEDKNQTIDEITNRLNTAYYISDTEKNLITKNILLKTGGFLGFLGRSNILSQSINRSSLEKIDIREKQSFTVNAELKKVEIISMHPAGSYELKSADAGSVLLSISDPEKFWEGSKYLVIAYR